ncbi:MAG: ABC transporter permease [candidate division WOR-3 bacterium]
MINIGELDPFGQGLELVRGGAGTYFATTDQSSGIESRYVEIKRKIFYSYLLHQNLVSYIKGLTSFSPSDLVKDFLTYQMFWGTESYYYMLDSEPVELSGGIAFTIRSSYAKKDWRGDPYKYNISYNEISLLIPQFAIVTHIISSIINEAELGISWFDVLPRRLFVQKAWGGGIGSCFITLKGRTLEYNLSTGWYTAVPNALTRVRASVDPYPFNDYLVFSDHNGSFEIHGLSAYMFIPGGKYFIDAWVIDELSGKIKYAPNSGIYGAKNIVPAVSPLSHPEECTIILMNVETVELFDVINPQTGTTGLIPDLRSPSQMWFYNVGCMIMVQNFDYKGEPLFYGVYYNGYEPVALAFALPRSRVMIMASVGGLIMPIKSCPFLILINSSEIEPEGHGFLLKEEEKYWYYGDALKYAQDILYVTRFRYNLLKSRGVQSISVEEKLSKAEEYFKEAIHNYSNSVFSQAYTNAFVAWAWGVRAYEEVMSLINDSGRTSLFFFVLILISAFLFERLLFRSISGRKQIGGVLIIGIVLLSFFSFIHPALQIMTNSLMAVLGLLSLVLFALVFIILVDETRKTLKEISYRILGYHAVEVGRISLTSITFTTSIENMRRRKMRTLLVFITLLTIAFSLTSLTSISPYIGVKFVPYGVPFPDSSDILIKNGISTPTRDILGSHTIDIIKGIIGERAEIMPRVWYYPTSIGPNIGVVTRISCLDKNLTYPINAVLGLTYQEAILLLSKYATTPILPSSVGEFWCLIPDSAANILDVNIGEYILFQGMRIRIIGIYNSSLAGSSLIDLRGNSIAPIDPYYVASLGIGVTVPLASGQEPPSLSWSRFIVIPYDVALKMGGYVAEISLRFMYNVDKEVMEKILRELSNVLDITVYAKIDNNVFVSSRVSTFSAFGLEGVIVLLVISSFNVIVTLLNIQRERIRDMYVYATIGLSPSGAILMTILEALVYSALSITVGYFLGFVGNTVFRSLGILPATFAFNYASVFAMMSLLILFVAALISSFYPAHVASRLITPSLERKWKPPTEPRGDAWELPLPLKLEQIEEVRGLMLFLKEYYLGVGIEKPSFRIDNLKVDFSNPKGPEIILTVSLVPYEANTKESVRVIAQYIDAENKYAFITLMRKESGDKNLWIHGSYEFADDLRRQILLWRLLPEERRRKYISMAKGEG